MTSTAAASIDFLSDISQEVLTASGTYGSTYALQLQSERAQRHLSNLRENLYEQIDRDDRAAQAQGRIGSLTPAHERVENDPEVKAARERVEELRVVVNQCQAQVGGIVFLPATDNLDEIKKRLTALNKKASKLDTEPITLQVTDEKLVLNYNPSTDPRDVYSRGYDFEHVFCVLSGATPKIPGFEFLATVTHTDQGNVIKRIPAIAYGIRHNLSEAQWKDSLDSIDLTKYHSTGNLCEQCGLHRERLDTFIVYNEQTGETKQVGRNCLRDYTGLNNPEKVLKVLEQVWEFMRSMRGSRGERPVLTTKTFLTHCATIVRTEGGYVKGLGYDAASNHYNMVNRVMSKDRPPQPLWIEPIPADEQMAETVLAWLPEWDETSEFATNVKISLGGPAVNSKLYGIAGAAFIAREKWASRQRQAKQNAAKTFVGTVGQRETFILTVTGIKWIANDYARYNDDATKPLILMEDEQGNEVKWFASDLPSVADRYSNTGVPEAAYGVYTDGERRYHLNSPAIGGTYQVKATVKKHDDNERYGKSTLVNRAKFEKTISEPEEEK